MRKNLFCVILILGFLMIGGGLLWSGGAQEAQKETTAVGPKGELRVFVVWGDVMKIINEAFEAKYPNVKLQYDSAGPQQYETILKTKLAAGDAPDIMTVWSNARTADPAKRGIIRDLTNESYTKRVLPSMNAEMSYKGKTYAILYDVVGEGLFYNRKMLSNAGLETPMNWDELLAAGSKSKQAGVQPIAAGFKEDWTIMRYTNSAFAAIGYGRDSQFEEKLIAGTADFNYKGWRETFDKLKILIDKGYLGEHLLSTDNTQALAEFTQAKTAMWIMGTWSTADIRKGAGDDFDLGFTAMPVNDKGEDLYGCWKVGSGMAVSAKTKNWEAANAYIATFADKEVHRKWAIENKQYAAFSDVIVTGIDPATDEFVKNFVAKGRVFPGAHYKWPAGMSNNWKKKLQEYVGGVINTDQMVEWLNREYASMENLYK